jgi:hypothetical protein
MVVADERLQGAQLLRRPGAARDRAREIRGLAEALLVRTRTLRTIGREMSYQLRHHPAHVQGFPWKDVEPHGRVIDAFPTELHGRLFLAGLDVHWLRTEVPEGPSGDPYAQLARSADEASKRSFEFAKTAHEDIARASEHLLMHDLPPLQEFDDEARLATEGGYEDEDDE